jgi:hypothetical protein
VTKKPCKGKNGKNITPIKGKKDKAVHSDPKRPTGRERPPKDTGDKGEGPRGEK